MEKCKEYILAGDIFQVVLSQRLSARTQAEPFNVYRALRVINPSPYMFYLHLGGLRLVGSSPEVMVKSESGKVTVRPIAGTRPRGATDEEDAALAAELLADPKERAEHIMLLDLGRNDVGRICRYGTVKIEEEMIIERFSHVMHMTSTVTGLLDDGKTCFDAFRNCFPAGTRLRRAENPRDGNPRRTRAGQARPLRRRGRLRGFPRQPRHLHRHPHAHLQRPARSSSRPAPASSRTPCRNASTKRR